MPTISANQVALAGEFIDGTQLVLVALAAPLLAALATPIALGRVKIHRAERQLSLPHTVR